MDLIPFRHKRRSATSADLAQRPLASFRDEVEQLFERIVGDPWGAGSSLVPWGGNLRLDLSESDKEVTVTAELPGVKPEDVNIEVTGNTLTLSGEKREETDERRGEYRYTERQFGQFSRTIQLPVPVDADKVSADVRDGVLTITAPKHPEATPRRIKVRNA